MHKLPSASAHAQSTAAVIILFQFAAHERPCGADARAQKEHRSTAHPLVTNTLQHPFRRGSSRRASGVTLLAATGGSAMDTDDAGKEVTETEPSWKALPSPAVHMENGELHRPLRSAPMRRGRGLTRPLDGFHRRHPQNVAHWTGHGNVQHTVGGRTRSHPRLVNDTKTTQTITKNVTL